jgi:transposase
MTDSVTNWYKQVNDDERETFRKWITSVLRTNTVRLTFRKKDDTIREMVCTLMESKLPETDRNKTSKENIESMPVFDLEKKEWRAFRFDSIQKIEFTLGE